MAKEIENKYICKYLPSYVKDPILIQQAYIHVDKEKQVRIRIQEGKAILCVKLNNVWYRDEYEAELPIAEGMDLFSKCQYKVEKLRWSFDVNGVHYDIDKFQDGTLIAELERKDLETKTWIPDFVGECVDGIWEYTNYYYAGIPKS